MAEPLKLHYDVLGGDFTSAGNASVLAKKALRQLGFSPDIIRRISIAMYEGEINMVIHANGGNADIIVYPKAADRPSDNLRFLIGDAEHLGEWVEPHSVSRIYLNFSDPWPKKGYAKRRLTHRRFLELYRTLLIEGGELYLKTDNVGLFDFSLEEFEAAGLTLTFMSRDFHATPEASDNIMTEYEANFSSKGMPICCARVRF